MIDTEPKAGQSSPARHFTRAEFILLNLFCVMLPLAEAPKNILLGLLALLWCFNSACVHNWGQQSFAWSLAFLAMLSTAALAAFMSPLFPPDKNELGDIASYLVLGTIMVRTSTGPREISALAASLIAATLAGIIQGLWMLWHDSHRIALQLNSVGQVNHSALYAMGICIVALAAILPRWKTLETHWQNLALLLAVAMTASMVAFGSRGALVTLLIPMAIFLANHQKRLRLPLVRIAVCCLVIATGALFFKRDMLEKTLINFSASGSITALRAETTHTAYEVWRHSQLVGVGPGNLPLIGYADIRRWLAERRENFDASHYTDHLHAHNLYFNTLAERGLLGLLALTGFGTLWAVCLLRLRPATQDDANSWSRWGIGLGGFSLIFVGGLFNTTFHHEHGMLAMLCLGILLNGSDAWNRATAS